MRWSIVRLIWFRELRDQLRDRRTVFMIAVLPVLLYPVAGFGVLQLAAGFLNQRCIVGIVGIEHLDPWEQEANPVPTLAWFSMTPPAPGVPLAGVERFAAAACLASAPPYQDYPPLLEQEKGEYSFRKRYIDTGGGRELIVRQLGPLEVGPVLDSTDSQGEIDKFLANVRQAWRKPLDDRKLDLILVIPPGFQQNIRSGDRPLLFVLTREQDDTSRLVNARVSGVLGRWRKDLKDVRLARLGLPPFFDEPFQVFDPERAKPIARQEEEGLSSLLVRIFPFVLVMWSLAGALYPAVDLCAGEKERGTMETLLVSPASRDEIVWGKFLTIWVFSAGTALLNLLSMGWTTWQVSALPGASSGPLALLWGVLLLLPLSAFFSALCLAVGAYARSSKEGQYYLMPLFLMTMPLIFLTLAPGVELNPFYSMVPVTGVALLLQKLITSGTPDRILWIYFIPVLAPMLIYSWLALRWAIAQFQSEEVLFREAERLDLGLWFRSLLREKEPLPTAQEAIFCFGLILVLRWLSFHVGVSLPLLTRTGISHLAFVATPPLFMVVLLTTRPRQGLALRWPAWWSLLATLLLALLVFPPLAALGSLIFEVFPNLRNLLEMHNPLPGELRSLEKAGLKEFWGSGDYLGWLRLVSPYFFVLVVLPALCEEIAFRGFILAGLLRGFRPRTAILLSSFLFALYPMNVFQFVPHFLFGLILAFLVYRTGSIVPAIVFHLVYNTLFIAPVLIPGLLAQSGPVSAESPSQLLRLAVVVGCAGLAGLLLALFYFIPKAHPELTEPPSVPGEPACQPVSTSSN